MQDQFSTFRIEEDHFGVSRSNDEVKQQIALSKQGNREKGDIKIEHRDDIVVYENILDVLFNCLIEALDARNCAKSMFMDKFQRMDLEFLNHTNIL